MSACKLTQGLRHCIAIGLLAWAALAAPTVCAETPRSVMNSNTKEPDVPAYETEEFTWSLTVGHYNIDMGRTGIETLEYGNSFRDAQGKELMRFYGSSGRYGAGLLPMGGSARRMRLPKTLQLTYYDYQEDRFYQLNAELPQQKIYELFQQKIVDIDGRGKGVVPRFNAFTIGIAPQGYVMVWISTADGLNQMELTPVRAEPMRDMTVQKYNSTGNYDPMRGGRAFPLKEDRWGFLSDGTKLKPETIAKLKSGWVPPADPYLQQRIKYPWRFVMTGTGNLKSFNAYFGNQESVSVQPWEIATYKVKAEQRGIPAAATFWFHDPSGKRHSIFMGFFTKMRVKAEEDFSEVWRAFEAIFPKRTLDDNALLPTEAEMATVEINVSDDLKTYTATLVKGPQRISLPVGKTQFFDLEPNVFWPGNPAPPAEFIQLLQSGPASGD